ncbi:hypothetical protein [uncultured Phocaeicola sp.]|jgi:DNA-binding NarL/FixJ family response regulator|uniref:hypothetical protein n=1 Tax=uncultured Phocaeicola sp. TaxID=990718 RepID=UPI0025AE37CF|nr:hypothetical protein [uncultured Phocaeicola sp.]
MKTTTQIFEECLAQVPNDVKMELDMSFALADKIDGILRERDITQKQLARKMGKTEAEVSQLLRYLHEGKISNRKIARIIGLNKETVNNYEFTLSPENFVILQKNKPISWERPLPHI